MVKVSSKGKESLDLLLKQAHEETGFPGLVLAVTDTEGNIYEGSAGLRVHKDPSSGLISPDDFFWICSMTKLITSVAAIQLIEQGKISLDTPVTDIIPELSNAVVLDRPLDKESTFKPAQNIIKVSHLLNHSSGLSYQPFGVEQVYGLPYPYICEQRKQNSVSHFYDLIKGKYPGAPLHFEPGTGFAYGYNTDTLGFIVERVTGKNLHEYCTENIFAPLDMKATFYLTPEVRAKSVAMTFREPATGEFQTWANQTPFIEQDLEKSHLFLGGIGVYTSVNDYLKLLRNLMQVHAGVATKKILNQESVRGLFDSTLTDKGVQSLNEYIFQKDSQWGTGFGINTTDWPGRRRKGSGCWFGWAGTYYFLDPTSGIAAVIGTQLVPGLDPDLLALWVKLEETLYASVVEEQ